MVPEQGVPRFRRPPSRPRPRGFERAWRRVAHRLGPDLATCSPLPESARSSTRFPGFWQTSMADTDWFARNGYPVLFVAHWTTATAPNVPASSWAGNGWTFWQHFEHRHGARDQWAVDLIGTGGRRSRRLSSFPDRAAKRPWCAQRGRLRLIAVDRYADQRPSDGGPDRTLGTIGLTTRAYNRMVVSMQDAFNPDHVFAALSDATRRDIVLRAMPATRASSSSPATTP